MSFSELSCKRSVLDALPSMTQRLLATDMVCKSAFNHYNLVHSWYLHFNQDIYKFGSLMATIVILYVLIFFPVAQKIMVPSFLSIKKRLNATSIFMSGLIYPIVFNSSILINLPESPYQNYRYSVLTVSLTVGMTILLMSMVFGVLHHFANQEMTLPSYPIYITFSFIALGFTIIVVNGIYGHQSIAISILMLCMFVVYTFAIQWAEKKEVEQLEKARRANEALENFQKMMGGDIDNDNQEKEEELARIKEEQKAKREEKSEMSTSEEMFAMAFDPEFNSLHTLLLGPIIMILMFTVPFHGNPLLKTRIKPFIISIGILIVFELNFFELNDRQIGKWWVHLIAWVLLLGPYWTLKLFSSTKKVMSTITDFVCIFVVFGLASILQLWVDDVITFLVYYFSLDIGAGFALLNSFKNIIIDTGTNIQLIRLGEKDAMLNSYTSPIFMIFIALPILNLISIKNGNYDFPIFWGKTDYFIDTGGVNSVTHNYLKTVFAFAMVLMIVKMIYYIVSDFKLNIYLRRTLYSIYVTFLAMSFYYGTMKAQAV